MYEQFLVTYKAEYEVWAESEEEAVRKALQEHEENPEGGFEASKIEQSGE